MKEKVQLRKTTDNKDLIEISSWENILLTNQEVEPPIMRESGVIGIDYTKINDFAAAGVLTKRGGKFIFKQHTWICANSADLPHIKFPYKEAVAAGDAEIIDAPEIPTELIADWVAQQAAFYNISMLALDAYRFALMREALARVGFSYENKNIKLVRPSDVIKIEPIIDSGFCNHNIVYGDCPIMRWYTNNTKKVKYKKYGNYEYKKIEAKRRKTEGFFAFVAAMTQHELIPERQPDEEIETLLKALEIIAKEVIKLLRTKKLPIWKAKAILDKASNLVERESKLHEDSKKNRVFYLCNGKKLDCKKKGCYKRGGDCQLTKDIEYASNFIREENRSGIYYTEERSKETPVVINVNAGERTMEEIVGKALESIRTSKEEHSAKIETRQSAELEGITIDLPTHDIQQAQATIHFSFKEIAALNEMISTALLSGKIDFDEDSKSVHQKITNAIMEKQKGQ